MKVSFKNCTLEFQKFNVDITSSQFTIPKRVQIYNGEPQIFDYSTSQVTQDKWCYSAQIDVSNINGYKLKINSCVKSDITYIIVFFSNTPDASNVMSSSSITPTSETIYVMTDYAATIPSGAKYAWVTCHAEFLSGVSGSIERQ